MSLRFLDSLLAAANLVREISAALDSLRTVKEHLSGIFVIRLEFVYQELSEPPISTVLRLGEPPPPRSWSMIAAPRVRRVRVLRSTL